MELSKAESMVLNDLEFFRLKRTVTEKLDMVFASLQEQWKPVVASWRLPVAGIDAERGKIFRGENYRGYPYVIMDYPKLFQRESVFAFRTMCWWGHEFSFTLHVQGEALHRLRPDLSGRLSVFAGTGSHFCVNSTPWEYFFEPENFRWLDECPMELMLQQADDRGFLKISRRLPLSDHAQLEAFGMETVRQIGRFLD